MIVQFVSRYISELFFKHLGRVKQLTLLHFHLCSRNNRPLDGISTCIVKGVTCNLYSDKQFWPISSHLGDFMKGALWNLSIGVLLEHLGCIL